MRSFLNLYFFIEGVVLATQLLTCLFVTPQPSIQSPWDLLSYLDPMSLSGQVAKSDEVVFESSFLIIVNELRSFWLDLPDFSHKLFVLLLVLCYPISSNSSLALLSCTVSCLMQLNGIGWFHEAETWWFLEKPWMQLEDLEFSCLGALMNWLTSFCSVVAMVAGCWLCGFQFIGGFKIIGLV